ncbi:MAG: hypothetical protein ACRD0S_03645 [Acidimicrobiales bacterium]
MSLLRDRPLALVVTIDAAAWAAVQVGTGYLVHRLPVRRLDHDGWLWRARPFERGGRFYTDVLRIRRWKDLLPEAGALFEGGFGKRRLRGASPADLDRFAVETRRAELGHWLAVLPTPLFVWANPPLLAPFMAAYPLLVNGPCIAAQRHNRIRLRRAAARAAGRLRPPA